MITLALVQNGAKVFITSRNADKLKDVAEKYGKTAPGEIIPSVTISFARKQLIGII
jgi:NADP-dependent 3-hydroxy acid dehydrogenase YdfG